MSALLTPRRPRREQPSLFSATIAPPAPAASAASGETKLAGARRQGPTLDDLVAGAWESLLAGVPAACVVCGTATAPRYSAAGVVGGRCGGCGSTLA